MPDMTLHRFHGTIQYKDGRRIATNKDNLLLRDYVVKNTNYVEGLVLYAGHETKAMLNNKGPRHKISRLERQMNNDIIWCIIILVVMCAFNTLMRITWLEQFNRKDISNELIPFLQKADSITGDGITIEDYFVIFMDFFVFTILYQMIIPISLYVCVEFIKLGQIWYTINKDQHFVDTSNDKRLECRALNITEDLGQVEYMFCDKTGTLTENTMEFRCCTIKGIDYGHDPEVDMAEMTYEQCKQSQ